MRDEIVLRTLRDRIPGPAVFLAGRASERIYSGEIFYSVGGDYPAVSFLLQRMARAGLRFVNRQPGSGTRLCLDFLLGQQGVQPAQIHGYAHEEFTHAAVAATVATGMADVGFGIEAAAREQGLDFVPVVNEHYYLAARASVLSRPGVRALLEFFDSREFRRLVNSLAGYRSVAKLDWLNAMDIIQ